jgi:hypothetical protein
MLSGEAARSSYEGLNQEATAVWRKFLALYQDQFQSFTYNVRVGRGLDPGPSVSDEIRRMWHAVTSKRIDCVAERLGQTWVIEIEPRPGLRTFGQIMGYLHLLPTYRAVAPIVIGAVVCERLGYDMGSVFIGHNVAYFVFPPTGRPRWPSWFPPSEIAPTVAIN